MKAKIVEQPPILEVDDMKKSYLFLDWVRGKSLDREGLVGVSLEYGHILVLKRVLRLVTGLDKTQWLVAELVSQKEFSTPRKSVYLPPEPGEIVELNSRNILYAFDFS